MPQLVLAPLLDILLLAEHCHYLPIYRVDQAADELTRVLNTLELLNKCLGNFLQMIYSKNFIMVDDFVK